MADDDKLRAGEQVVVYTDSVTPGVVKAPKVRVIDRVAAKSFVVQGLDERFDRTTWETKRRGGAWSSTRYKAVPVDSDEARALFAEQDKSRKVTEAIGAVEAWRRSRTRQNRLAAIDALRAVED